MKTYTVETFVDGEDIVMPIPEELSKELGLNEGDTLQWSDNKNGTFTLKKVKTQIETEIVLVEAIMVYRIRYAVEVPKGKIEYALDTVTCESSKPEFKEFSQLPLDEIISSYRVVDKNELLKTFDEDNEYLQSWSDDHKLDSVVNKWKDEPSHERPDMIDDIIHSQFWHDTERNK